MDWGIFLLNYPSLTFSGLLMFMMPLFLYSWLGRVGFLGISISPGIQMTESPKLFAYLITLLSSFSPSDHPDRHSRLPESSGSFSPKWFMRIHVQPQVQVDLPLYTSIWKSKVSFKYKVFA